MTCNTCTKPITILVNAEMICFPCRDARIQAKPLKIRISAPLPTKAVIPIQ